MSEFTLIGGSLRFVIRLHGRNVDRINAISCGNSKQVTLSTTKLKQNKEKNKNSEFWNDNNELPPASWGETKFNLLFLDRVKTHATDRKSVV